MRRCLSFMLALFLVAVFVVSAKAAFTKSYAMLDWSNFTWQGISLVPGQPAPTISWISQEEGIFAMTQNDIYLGGSNNWSHNLTGSISSSLSEAEAKTVSNEISSYSVVYTSDYVYSSAIRAGEFQVSGSGLIVFSIPYIIGGEIDDSSGILEYASLESAILLQLSSEDNPNCYSESVADLSKDYSNGDIGRWTEDGVISVSFYFNDGEIGIFNAGTYTYAEQEDPPAAPIPSSIIILTSGIGIIFIRRYGDVQ